MPTATNGAAGSGSLTHDDVSSRAGAQISYEDLYQRWEQSNWQAHELDFTEDAKGWAGLSDIQRDSALWIYSMFFYGEDAVTDGLSPYVDAAPRQEQKYFLATQQVDEARHAVFFHRFFKEVIGAGDTLTAGLAFTEPYLNWGYRGVFNRLETMADELRNDHSLPKFAQAIALYHLVIEAAMAQPGQHFIEDFFTKEGTMPGFSEGMQNVSRDEQRHIGFGVKVLSELLAESEECIAAVEEVLAETLPYLISVFTPPGWDERYTTSYGFTLEDIVSFGMRSVEAKWRAIGLPLDEMAGGSLYPFDPEMPHDQRARRQITLMKAGVLGEPGTAIARATPEVQSIYFDVLSRSAKTAALDAPMTLQWRFTDAEPWHLKLNNGSSAASPGLAEGADLTLESTWGDWVEFSKQRESPAKAILTRKLRPSGGLRNLARMGKVFGPPSR